MYPILFQWGPVTIGSYGVVVIAGFLAGLALMPRYARRAGMDPFRLRRVFLDVFLAGAIGCRLLQVLLRLPEVFENPSVLWWAVRQAGVWYGAIGGGLLATLWLSRRHGLDVAKLVDVAAVPAVIGGGIGRIGCLLSGCCWGTPTDLPWGITYTNPVAHALHRDLPYGRLHPAPLYELLVTLGIAVVLDRFGARPRPKGQVALLWIALYGVARALLEIVRADPDRGTLIVPFLSTSQTIGIASAVLAVALLVWRGRRTPRPGPGPAPA